MRRVAWGLPAMQFFVDLAAEVLGCEKMVGGYVGECDVVHVVGMYDAPLYETTLSMTRRAKQRIIHWCGTDVSLLQDASVLPEALHVCDSDDLRRELFAKGVEATTVMWPTRHHFPVTPLPDKKRVAVYLGSDPIKYGNATLQVLAEALPDVEFVGYMFGQYGAEQMAELVASSSLYVRLTRHDGSAASAREFMEAGRPVIVTHELPHAIRVRHDDITGIVAAVVKALKRTEPDAVAAAYWKHWNCPERFRAEMGALDG